METIRGDLHVHTKYSMEPRMLHVFKTLPLYGPEKVIEQAIKQGMGVVTVTDHDSIRGAEIGEKIAKKRYKDIIFVKGEEVSTNKGHMLGLGLETCIKPGLSPEETIEQIHAQGGVAVAPHPYVYYGLGNLIFDLDIDGVEMLNPWAAILHANATVKKIFKKLDVAAIGSTDAHLLNMVGHVYTEFKLKQHSVNGVLDAIRKKRTTADSDLNHVHIVTNLFKGIGLSFLSIGRKNV